MQVIHQLHNKTGFTVRDCWKNYVRIKTLSINGVEAEHNVVYIIHEPTGHVITSPCKAWNDTVRNASRTKNFLLLFEHCCDH